MFTANLRAAPMAPTMIAGGVLYPPSLLWSLPFVPNLLYANVFTMLPSLPASPTTLVVGTAVAIGGRVGCSSSYSKGECRACAAGASSYNDLLVVGPGFPTKRCGKRSSVRRRVHRGARRCEPRRHPSVAAAR